MEAVVAHQAHGDLVKLGSLWIGGNLSWLEQLCIKSFLDHGHDFTLYTYEGVTNAPKGTIIADANPLFPKEEFIVHRASGSSALHSDIFRYHMIARTGLVWVDCDMLCMRPWIFPSGHVYGWEKPGKLICGAALGFPSDSAALRDLIAFCDDPTPIPAWYNEDEKAKLRAAHDAGKPVHVSDMPWGVWGPAALTHYLHATGEVENALPQHAFYPIPFKDRRDMLDPDIDIKPRLGGEACWGVHLWNRRLRRRLVTHHNNVPEPGSFVGQAVERHGIDMLAFPIPDVPPPAVQAARAARAKAEAEAKAKAEAAALQDGKVPYLLRDTLDPAADRIQKQPPDAMRELSIRPSVHQSRKFRRMANWLENALESAGPWLAPPKKTPNNEKILVVTAMKNEAPFILEWIAYNRAIGVDHFLVYTNDCSDNTVEILDRLGELGLVTRRDNPYVPGGRVKPQHAALKDATGQPIYQQSDWIITIDLDEFIAVHIGDGTLQDLFRATNHPNAVSLTWRFFGNGGVIGYEDRPIIEQFTRCAPEMLPDPGVGWGFKTLFNHKTCKFRRLGVHRPAKMTEGAEGDVRWVNGSGRVMPRRLIEKGWRTVRSIYGYKLASLNHYALRSAESYLVKRDRGRINHTHEDQGVYYWQRRNYITEQDTRIHAMLPRLRKELARLKEDATLAALHDEAVSWHRTRIERLKADPDYARVFDGLVRTAREDATFFAKTQDTAEEAPAPKPPSTSVSQE